MTTPVINCIKSHKIFVLYMQHCMECAGLYPLTDSFDLLQPDYIQSLGLDHSFVRGFASSLQSHVLNTMYMGYCSESGEVACDPEALRSVVCKVHCKILQNSFLNLKKMVMFVWLFCFFFFVFLMCDHMLVYFSQWLCGKCIYSVICFTDKHIVRDVTFSSRFARFFILLVL